jgi:hypothetical protein
VIAIRRSMVSRGEDRGDVVDGEAVEHHGPRMKPRGRTIDDAERRRLNDLIYGLLVSGGLSPHDAHLVLSMKRSPGHRRRRHAEMTEHAPELLSRLSSLSRGTSRAG